MKVYWTDFVKGRRLNKKVDSWHRCQSEHLTDESREVRGLFLKFSYLNMGFSLVDIHENLFCLHPKMLR
jgi:hypothetical protein